MPTQTYPSSQEAAAKANPNPNSNPSVHSLTTQDRAQQAGWKTLLRNRSIFSWALYDWANSSFATTVMAGFFPVFFKTYWSSGADVNISTYQLGFANSLASGVLAILSPVIGSFADQGSAKKKALLVFTLLGVIMTGSLFMVAKGQWPLAIAIYLFANVGFAGGNNFYDSLLTTVSRPSETQKVSAMGYSLGYLGGGLLFALNVGMVLYPQIFGFSDQAVAIRASFLTVAIWWFVFTLPLLLFVHEEQKPNHLSPKQIIVKGLSQVLYTFHDVRSKKNLGLFLIAYFFYIDGVNTIMRMAVDYGLSLGFPSESLIVALLLTQFVGFPAAFAYGWFAEKVGSKNSLYMAILVYAAVCVFSYSMSTPTHFYVLAIVIGLVQGGIQAVSRSVFANMIPREQAGEYFGFFNMIGKFSSVMGPYLIGAVSLLTHNSRLSILSIVLLFAIGSFFLYWAKLSDSLKE